MKKIVFIGNSLANVKALEEIRKSDQESEIVLVSADAFFPYGRDKALSFLAREIKEKQVFEKPESFYKDHQIKVLTGQTISRFNFKRSQIFFENKEQLSYDILVLSDLATPRLPALKGHHKSGVYQSLRLADIKIIGDQIPFADTIVVQVTSIMGFLTACALASHAQNLVICASAGILTGILDRQSSDIMRQFLESTGVRLMLDNPIDEILGDSDAKAVRFRSGKVMAAEMVVLDNVRLDVRPFLETGLGLPQEVGPSSDLRSNVSNVFLVDAVRSAFETSEGPHYDGLRSELENQGIALARSIAGLPPEQGAALCWARFKFRNISGFWLGDTRPVADPSEFTSFDAEGNVYKKIFIQGGRISGAVCFNADDRFEELQEWVNQRTSLQSVEEKLLQEGFDLHELKSLESSA